MIDRQRIIEELEEQGKQHLTDEAMQRLPEQVHVGNNAIDLQQLGLDPRALAEKYVEGS
jgi:hypothetical protein